MFTIDTERKAFVGPNGVFEIPNDDEALFKLMMILEGECGALGPNKAAEKYGYSKARYFQVRSTLAKEGVKALSNKKRGPKTNYRCTDQLERNVIRYRYLDPDIPVAVITQKLKQQGFSISASSVDRVITKYGLQKKTASTSRTRR